MKKTYLVIIDTHSKSSSLVPIIRKRFTTKNAELAMVEGMKYISTMRSREPIERRHLWNNAEVTEIYERIYTK